MENYIVKDKTIIFSPNFNKKIEHGLLEKYFNVIFSNYELNKNLFECYKNNDFFNSKYIGSKFNQEINLPQNLTHLTFGRYFNQQVNLPPNLTHLTYGWDFNQQVNLPPNLTHLTYGSDFNQQVNLPQNLTQLTFGWNFNQQIDLPPNLTHLTLDGYFNQEINLSPNLTHLTFGYYFNQQVNLPFSVKFLKLDCNNVNIIDYLSDGVEELILGYCFNLKINDLPSSIKKVIIKNVNYKHELNCLPNNIEYLELPLKYDKEIKKYPNQLKTIKCHEYYKYIDKVKQNGFKIETRD